VRKNNDDDLARLARILAGRAIGIEFGGGGARGFAHLGALRAFEELGIKIDMIGGASIGAPIAGMSAQGKLASECLDLSIKAFSSLIDMTIPLTSMISGKRISRTIAEHSADWDIEDYWLPYFCVSTNLTTAKQVVHRCGNSATAIRSSVSIPGVLPPVPANGELLVDGGVLNNVPINIMREINPSGSVMAFDVAPPRGPTAKQDYGMSVSGWYQLASRMLPWLKPVRAPRVGVVLMQAMMVGSNLLREQMLQNEMADYYQNIHVRKVGMLDFKEIKRAARVGYESVIEPLRQWLEKSNRSD
jgi:predicted acylesterase/phospholipase RssA